MKTNVFYFLCGITVGIVLGGLVRTFIDLPREDVKSVIETTLHLTEVPEIPQRPTKAEFAEYENHSYSFCTSNLDYIAEISEFGNVVNFDNIHGCYMLFINGQYNYKEVEAWIDYIYGDN